MNDTTRTKGGKQMFVKRKISYMVATCKEFIKNPKRLIAYQKEKRQLKAYFK